MNKEELEKQTMEWKNNYILKLEKENAELKEKKEVLECDNYNANCNLNLITDQLTKAKELLKQWLQTSKASGCDNINIVTDTEQFLNSEGK